MVAQGSAEHAGGAVKALLRFFGLDALLEAILERFNLPFLIRAIRAFLKRHADARVDNKKLHEIALAAASKAETLYPKGHGLKKYTMVFDALVAAGPAWVREEVDDVADAFESWIDDMIQLVHAEIEEAAEQYGSSMLGSWAGALQLYPEADRVVVAVGGTF